MDYVTFVEELDEEIRDAKRASYLHGMLHQLVMYSTIIAGFATTYRAGVDAVDNEVTALLAAFTTMLGTLANQGGFKKKFAGYRLTKTEFQNLKLDILGSEDEEKIGKSEIARFKEIRGLKVARTTESG